MTANGSADIAGIFVEIADTLIDDFDLVEFLQMLTARASELSETHSAAVLLADQHHRLQFLAASDEQVHLLGMFQLSVDEGPCIDCFRFAAPIINVNLTNARARWPSFAPRAKALGLKSVHAFPLRLRGNVLGTMGLFSRESVRIPPDVARILQAIADVATIGIIQERALREGHLKTSQLQNSLTSRVIIEQAKGFIAQRYDVSVDDAFKLVRGHCRRNGLQLREVSQTIVISGGRNPDLRTR